MSNKHLYIVYPTKDPLSPSYLRVKEFENVFKLNYHVSAVDLKLVNILKLLLASKTGRIIFFVSMPAFRSWWIFLLPRIDVILDIRDGWSIAMASGYGKTVKPQPLKAIFAKIVERFSIRNSLMAIACTFGLCDYLENISGIKMVFIPNGMSSGDLDLIRKLKINHLPNKPNGVGVFVCSGQFSEYGVEKVKILLHRIFSRYSEKFEKIEIKLIGSSVEKNNWVQHYFSGLSGGRGYLNLLPKMSRSSLYKEMLNSDFGIAIVRDPSYDYGTKIYDYIALGLSVVNYFDEPNNFTQYFDPALDFPFISNKEMPEIDRGILIQRGMEFLGK